MTALRLGHLYPEYLNIYADRGNIAVLTWRAARRGIDVEVRAIGLADEPPVGEVDLFYVGGGQDREQALIAAGPGSEDRGAARGARPGRRTARRLRWLPAPRTVLPRPLRRRAAGCGLLPLHTVAGERRMIGDVLLECELEPGDRRTLAGFENHAGRTFLDDGATPLGRVVSGFGNDGESATRAAEPAISARTSTDRCCPATPGSRTGCSARRCAPSRRRATGARALEDELEHQAHAVSAARARDARRPLALRERAAALCATGTVHARPAVWLGRDEPAPPNGRGPPRRWPGQPNTTRSTRKDRQSALPAEPHRGQRVCNQHRAKCAAFCAKSLTSGNQRRGTGADHRRKVGAASSGSVVSCSYAGVVPSAASSTAMCPTPRPIPAWRWQGRHRCPSPAHAWRSLIRPARAVHEVPLPRGHVPHPRRATWPRRRARKSLLTPAPGGTCRSAHPARARQMDPDLRAGVSPLLIRRIRARTLGPQAVPARLAGVQDEPAVAPGAQLSPAPVRSEPLPDHGQSFPQSAQHFAGGCARGGSPRGCIPRLPTAPGPLAHKFFERGFVADRIDSRRRRQRAHGSRSARSIASRRCSIASFLSARRGFRRHARL